MKQSGESRRKGKGKAPQTFRENVRRQFMIYALIPVVLLMAVFIAFVVYNTHDTIRQRTRLAGDMAAASIRRELSAYRDFALELAGDPGLAAYIDRPWKSSRDIYQAFYAFNGGRDVKSSLHILDAKGRMILSSRPLDKTAEDYFDRFIYPRIEKNEGDAFFEGDSLAYEDGKTAALLMAAPVLRDGLRSGQVLLLLEQESFFDLVNVADNEVALVTDAFDTVLVGNNRAFANRYNKLDAAIAGGGDKGRVGEQDYYVLRRQIPEFKLSVYTANAVTPGVTLYRSLIVFSAAMILVFFLLLRFLADRIAQRTSASIGAMIDAVRHTRNAELDFRVDIRTNDEFQVLGEQFNKMQARIETLLRNNEELMNLRREAEVGQLEAQFNPHFLFNVLETLRYSLYFDQNVSQEIIASLSRLLKYSSNREKAEYTLGEDLRYLEEFLRLHKFRFGEKMQFTLHIDEALSSLVAPKLILQPIVENSLKYGYQKRNAISIDIHVWEQDGWLCIRVEDDGGGVSLEKLAAVRAQIKSDALPGEHTGLYNSNRRLELMYGKGSGLTVDSVEGASFTVTVRLPARRKGILDEG